MRPSNPLREELRAAATTRDRLIRQGKSRRKDVEAVRQACVRILGFLGNYPCATDERVREWCISHRELVSMVVVGHHHRRLQRLLIDELKTKAAKAA